MNKNLNQLWLQLSGIWKQLGLNQRISIALATLVVLGGLVGVAFWSSHPDYSLLYGKLDDAEAAKVIAALDEAKVPYEISRGGGAIMVPSDKVYAMRMQLAGKGIPRGDGVGFEIFDKANFGISDFVQRANYTRAVQGELSRTIGQLDDVDSARVMIVMPENRLLTDSQRKATASVFVRVKGAGQLPASAVASIRFLVANSVEGLQVNNVSVVDNMGNVLSQNDDNDSVAGLSNNQLSARRNFEQYLSKKAEGMLDTVLGPGQAVVRVSADINWDSLTREETKYDPDGQVAKSSTINDETTDSDTATAGGAPGTGSNSVTNSDGSVSNVVAGPPVNRSLTKKKVTTSQYEINSINSKLTEAAGGLKRLSAAVFVAMRAPESADKKAQPRSEDEINKLKRIVQSALGIQTNSDSARQDEIVLEEMPFNDAPAKELSQQLDKQQTRQLWLDLVKQFIYPALAVGMLYAFWQMFKKAKVEEVRLGLPVTNGQANGNGNGNGHNRTTIPGKGVVTVEVLNQLIRENPANMTQAVRSWLGRANKENN